MSATCNAICIVLTVLSWKGVASQYDSSYAFVDVKNAATNQHERFCVNYEQFKTNTNLPTTVEDATAVKMSWWGSEDGNTNVCKTETRPNMAGTVVPLNYRLENSSGPCAYPFQKQGAWRGAFQYQVDQLTQHNVSTGLFLLRRGYNFFTNWHDFLFSDFYDPDLNHSSIPLFFTYNHTLFDDMLKLSSPGQSGADLEMRFYRPPSHVFDASMLIIWILAVFSITMGGYWSGRRKISLHSKERKYLVDQEKQTSVVSQSTTTTTMDDSEGTADVERLRRTSGPRQQQPPQPATTPVNCCTIIVMLIVIVGVLMLGYYFRFVMVYIFNVLLVVGGTFAMFGCLAALVGPIPCGRCRVCKSINDLTQSVFKREVFHWDCCQQRPMWRSVFLFLLSASVTITWFIIRNNAYAFILLDIINVCLCIHVIKGLRFPSLKWLALLLVVMFVYDMFMVFGTPYITSDGCSIMVQVAVGSDCKPAQTGQYPIAPVDANIPEILPMLFRVPRLSDPMLSCIDLSVDLQYRPIMLGLGDIIMPGFLVGYCFGVDLTMKRRLFYGPISVLSYGVGLIVTFIALTLMKIAQPALIYLVPFTFVPVCLVALCRKEFLQLWNGVEETDGPEVLAVLESGPSSAASSNHGTMHHHVADNGNTIH